MAGRFKTDVVLTLSPREANLLLDLLGEHIEFGWVERNGEFDLVSSGEVSPTLYEMYRRLWAISREQTEANDAQ